MKTMLHNLSRSVQCCRNDRGTAAIEVGLTILPFILAFMGVVEMGFYYFHQHTLQHATHEGMRIGLTGATLQDDNGNDLNREASIVKAITDHSNLFLTLTPADIQINPLTDVPGAPQNAGAAGALMRVQVNYTHEFTTPLIGGFFGTYGNFPMSAVATYRNENFLGGGS